MTDIQLIENEETNSMKALIGDVRTIIDNGLRKAYENVSKEMVYTYWQVGRRIVEEEQHGAKRAEYGKRLLNTLAEDLSKEYATGFSARDLRNYRQLYLNFNDLEIWYARVPNLTWTHYRSLLRVEDANARYWYSILNDSKQLFASKYLTFMPTQEELRREIEQQKEFFRLQHES